MNTIKIIIVLLLGILLTSCSIKTLEGNYKTNRKNEMSFSGKNIAFQKDSFEIFYWSDLIDSNKKGRGNFTRDKGILKLRFEDYKAPEAQISRSSFKSENEEFNFIRLNIRTSTGDPLIGVTNVLYDMNEKIIANCISSKEGQCILQWNKTQSPSKLKSTYLGFDPVEIAIDPSISESVKISMKEICKYFDSGKEMKFKIRPRPNGFVLIDGKRSNRYYKANL